VRVFAAHCQCARRTLHRAEAVPSRCQPGNMWPLCGPLPHMESRQHLHGLMGRLWRCKVGLPPTCGCSKCVCSDRKRMRARH
jgi:hypothetical protein